MIRLEHTVIIPLPLDQVFAYAADYRTWPEWFVGLSDVRPTTTTREGNGTRYAYKVRMMSVTAGVETEIREFERNVGWIGVGVRGLPHRTRWHFESLGEGTRFTYGLEGRVPVPLIGPLLDSWFMRPQWDKIVGRSLQNLRQRLLARRAEDAV